MQNTCTSILLRLGVTRRASTASHKPITSATRLASALPLGRHDLLPLLAKPFDPERDHVAGFEEFRLRLHAEPNAGRGAGDDDVARLHDEILRAGPDDFPAIENHGRGFAALAFLAVDVEPHLEILRVLKFIFGDEPGSERAEGLAAFAFGPLSGALDLKHALGDVVGKAIAGDDVECPF